MMQKPEQKRNLIVGLGSRLSRADAFGLRVCERLMRMPSGLEQTDIVLAGTDLIGLIDGFPNYSHVILVDALLDPDGRFGELHRVAVIEEKAFREWPAASAGVHQVSPLLAVRLFRELYRDAATRTTLVAYCTDTVSFADPESGELPDSVIDAALRIVCRLITDDLR